MSIPRNILQIWIGDKPMPSNCREWCAEWKALHPKWNYKLWGNELFDRYPDDPYIKWMKESGEQMAFVSDRFRVLLLREEGGVYLDADCQPVRKLDSISATLDNPGVDFVTGIRPPDRPHVSLHRGVSLVDNTVMMSAKDGKMIGRLCALYGSSSKKQTGYSMGLEIIRNLDESVRLLNWRYFYADRSFPETILLHDDRNLGSWSPKIPFNETQRPKSSTV